jgi:hypothetical protein
MRTVNQALRRGVMVRDDILQTLRQHMPEIRRHAVTRLAVFGSVSRGEERPDSDVDILVQFDHPVGLFAFVRLQRYLEELLGRSVDLVTPDALRPEMREGILAEAVYAA